MEDPPTTITKAGLTTFFECQHLATRMVCQFTVTMIGMLLLAIIRADKKLNTFLTK